MADKKRYGALKRPYLFLKVNYEAVLESGCCSALVAFILVALAGPSD